MRKVLFAALVAAMLLVPISCIVPDQDATTSDGPSATISIPGTDKAILVTPEILDKYAGGAEAAGNALPGPIGTVVTIGGIALASLAEMWRRKAKKAKGVSGVMVQALDLLRKNTATHKRLDSVLKQILPDAPVSEADFDKAVALLKEQTK